MKPELVRTNTETLRDRARQNIEAGAVTSGYKGDRAAVIGLLKEMGS